MWSKLYGFVKPTLLQCQIVGLTNFSFSSIEIKQSKYKWLYNIFLIVIYVLSTAILAYYFYNTSGIEKTIYFNATQFASNSGVIHFLGTMICIIRSGNLQIEIFNKLMNFDNKFKNYFNSEIDYYNNFKHFKWIFAYKIVLNLIYIIERLISHVNNPYIPSSFSILHIIIKNPIFPNYFIFIFLMMYIYMVKYRFTVLNNIFKKTIANRNGLNHHKIHRICNLHYDLIQIVDIINKTFGYIQLSAITFTFLYLVNSLYFVVIVLQANNVDWLHFFYGFVSSLVLWDYIISICHLCEITIQEVNIYKIFINYYRKYVIGEENCLFNTQNL